MNTSLKQKSHHNLRSFASLAILAAVVFSSPSNAEVRYEFEVGDKLISGSRVVDGKPAKFSFKTEEEEEGLILINPRLIATQLGDKETASQHPFSFAGPKPTSIIVTIPKNCFLFSSFKSANGKSLNGRTSQFVIGVANNDLWTKNQFEFMDTTFELVTPKKTPHISPNHWENSLKSIWQVFTNKFGTPTDHLVFVDLTGPISGGPLGENVLGVFATEKVNANIQKDMKANLGWEPKTSTKAYVEAYYPKSNNQWEEYLVGTFAHEIGHLFFGFGVTREKVSSADDLWFSLGLGMLYDMEITKQLTSRYPQLELDIIETWKSNYAKLADIDQRLVNPDKSSDKKYAFDRKKVFAHGKAAYYLSNLREKVGEEVFNDAVKEYLSKCRDCTGGYRDFKKFLGKYRNEIHELEKVHQVL